MSSYNIAVLISGSGSNLQAIIDACESGYIKNTKVALVVSDREGAFGLERAKKHLIKNVVISKKEPERLLKELEISNINGIVLAGYLSILPKTIIDKYENKIINIHPSLLPMFGGIGYYGLKVHEAVLDSGVSHTGATAHLVDNGVDTGRILVRAKVPVLSDDTAEELQKRVLSVEYKALIEAVKNMEKGNMEKLAENPITVGDDILDRNGQSGLVSILVVGNGGREHAIGWKLKQNPNVKLYFIQGNGGTAQLGENVNIKVNDIKGIADFAESYDINLTVVGPELPLTLGISDELHRRGLKVFGPNKEGAKIEGSKEFAKNFMKKYDIPTADFDSVTTLEEGNEVFLNRRFPLVLKADGLASGKGVIICNSISEAYRVLEEMLSDGVFGEAGRKVVIEEFLEGKEVSMLCLTDSKTIIPMETASDYKRALDKDFGVNTGGMGSISPSPYYTPRLGDEIAEKTLAGLKAEGIDYQGVLYIGLILTSDGPKVLEYNARFGDPETQALMPRLETDFYEVALAVAEKRLSEVDLSWKNEKAVTVVLTSKGYPGKYEVGHEMKIGDTKNMVFHAGTKFSDGKLLTDGGRVLAVTALGETFDAAREEVYDDIKKIKFDGVTYRTDIGQTKAQRNVSGLRF